MDKRTVALNSNRLRLDLKKKLYGKKESRRYPIENSDEGEEGKGSKRKKEIRLRMMEMMQDQKWNLT